MSDYMRDSPAVIASIELANWLITQLHEIEAPASLRTQLAGASFSIALDHHSGIGILLHNEREAPAFALLRLLFEAYVRGRWLAECASDEKLEAIGSGGRFPLMNDMLGALEGQLEDAERYLTASKKHNWDALNAYTHTGAHQLQRYLREGGIEASYADDEIEEALDFADAFALLSAVGIAEIAQRADLASKFLDRARAHAQ